MNPTSFFWNTEEFMNLPFDHEAHAAASLKMQPISTAKQWI